LPRPCHLLIALLATAAPAAAQDFVTPRPHAVIESGLVTLGDLFDNAGPRAVQPLGPAPAPGRRFVVEAPQLAIIARDNQLAWTPLAGDERVIVERPGRPLSREELDDALRSELVALGADPGLDVDLFGHQLPIVPSTGPSPRLAFEALEYDPATRRFSGTLLVLADGMATLRQRLSGRVVAMREVVVAARPLRAGEVLAARDLRAQRLPAERVRPGMAERIERAAGHRLDRAVQTGQPVALADLSLPATLLRDTPVQLQYEAPGLTITAQGRAMEDGALGATVPVMNLATGGTVLAEVLASDRVRPLRPLTRDRENTPAGRSASQRVGLQP
jgi:flagella basal body P-ring formation protein FlgA